MFLDDMRVMSQNGRIWLVSVNESSCKKILDCVRMVKNHLGRKAGFCILFKKSLSHLIYNSSRSYGTDGNRDGDGFKYILTKVDAFTKFVILTPTRNVDVEAV